MSAYIMQEPLKQVEFESTWSDISYHDQRRGQSFEKTFPEYFDLIKNSLNRVQ